MPFPLRNRHLLFGAASNPWTGATWALDGSGRAYNTPTLGSALLTNGGMETFSIGQATGWIKGGSPVLEQEVVFVHSGSSSQKMTATGTGNFIYQYPATIAGRFYEFSAYVHTSIRYIFNTNNGGSNILLGTHSAAQWDQIYLTGQGIGIASGFLFSGVSGGGTGYVDSVSLRELLQSTLVATVNSNEANPTITTKLNAMTATAGLVSKIDSQSDPQNYVSARFDGVGNLRLDKVVSGVLTNLQSNAVAFVAGAQLEIRWASSTSVGVWYNNVQIGANRTVSDAGITSNTKYGLLSTHVGNTFNEFRLGGNLIPFVFFN